MLAALTPIDEAVLAGIAIGAPIGAALALLFVGWVFARHRVVESEWNEP